MALIDLSEVGRQNYLSLPEDGKGGQEGAKLSTPSVLNVVQDRLSGSNPRIKWGMKTGVGQAAVPITVDGLDADQEYVVYFVLGGGSNVYSENVLAYRFKTEKVYRPVIRLSIRQPLGHH